MRRKYKKGAITYLKVQMIDLEDLFNREEHTIRRWIKQGYLDPTSLKSIIELYNQRVSEGKIDNNNE